jgi:hypothetical protein
MPTEIPPRIARAFKRWHREPGHGQNRTWPKKLYPGQVPHVAAMEAAFLAGVKYERRSHGPCMRLDRKGEALNAAIDND